MCVVPSVSTEFSSTVLKYGNSQKNRIYSLLEEKLQSKAFFSLKIKLQNHTAAIFDDMKTKCRIYHHVSTQ